MRESKLETKETFTSNTNNKDRELSLSLSLSHCVPLSLFLRLRVSVVLDLSAKPSVIDSVSSGAGKGEIAIYLSMLIN